MKRTRRKFSADFKAKVVLEALKEKSTIEVLAKKYELLPNQISTWKSEALNNFSSVFIIDKKVVPASEISSDKLYAKIGELTLENEFFKKKLC